MPATMTFKTLKAQALHLPPKRKAELTEALLQDEYDRECLEKAKDCFKGIQSGKISVEPYADAMRDLRKYGKNLVAKATSKR